MYKKRILGIIFLLALMNLTAFADDNVSDVGFSNYTTQEDYSSQGSVYYNNGQEFLKKNQYSEAITEFRKALRENPSDKSSRIQLVNAYLARAQYHNNKAFDYNKAANDLRSAVFYMKYYNDEPVDAQYITDLNNIEESLDNVLYAIKADQTPKGHYMMGKSLRAQGEFAAAVTEFQQSQTDTTYRADSLANLGAIYYILNLNNQAVSYLDQALVLSPKNSELHLKLAGAYERLGKLDLAAEQYNLSLSKSSSNQDVLLSLENIWKQKVSQNPNDAEAHANLGAVYQKRNNFEAALAQYKKAEELNPSNVTTRLNMGTLFQAKKDYETAIEAYDTILDVNPNFKLAYLYKAQCYKAMGNKTAAIENYKLALNLDPNNQEIRDELYDVYETSMTPEEKLSYIYQQVQKEPNNAALLYRYAFELHKANKLSEAVTYYNQALKLNPKNEDTYMNLAQAYKQQGNYDKARTLLTEAKGLFPENTTIKKQLSAIDSETASLLYSDATKLFNQKKYQEAINLYNKIVPATAESLFGIGASYQALGNNAKAAEYYVKSLKLDANNADTAYYAALAYSNAGDFAQAKTYAKKSLALEANNKNAKDLLTYVIEQENTVKMDKAIDLFDKKQYAQALNILNGVISQDPKDSNAYYYRAMVYDAQKKYQPAINDYKKALQYNPQMIIAYYSIAVDYDYLAQYANALIYHKKYLAETKKIGETNDYTRYSAKRIQDLKAYEPKPAAKK